MAQNLSSLGATRMVIGLSQIVRFAAPANFYGTNIKNITLNSGGSLEIIQPAFSGSSSVAATGWSQGYPLAPGEVISAAGPVSFYMAAMGQTATVAVMFGQTWGATLP